MTDHLTECPLLEPCSADTPKHGFCSRQNTICIHCERQCICERLIACERRVLDDAREAVAAWNCGWPDNHAQHIGCPCAEESLAVIDALKEKR